jgi:arginyl-tRNA synthetase
MIADKLKLQIAQAAGVSPEEVALEHPNLESFGDYSTSIAIKKKLNAQTIADKIPGASVAGPGFINIKLTNEDLVEAMSNIKLPNIGSGRTVVIDYSSPNIAKPFGIGHLRSTIIGQALYNLYKAIGYKVVGDNHLGDWGTQFGKLLYMIDRNKVSDFSIENLEKLYVEFHQHPEWEDEGRKWFAKLESGDPQAQKLWQKCVEVSMEEFERIYKRLGVKIDYAYGESFYEDQMKGIIDKAKSISQASEGAIVIETGHKVPLMLVKSDGTTTYATRDLATIEFREQTWSPNLVIYEVGAEQTLHFEQVIAAAKALGIAGKADFVHTKHGLYLSPDGKKFSTRKGQTVKLEEVLDEAVEKAGNEAVGIGAIKYYDLLHGVASNIVFDWDKILSLEGNSGPYLQYTYARCRSVLAKSQTTNPKSQADYELNSEELSVLRWVYRYPEVIVEAAKRFSPNLLCNFIYELAQRFNSFYNQCPILENEFRLQLTKTVADILRDGLNILGITALEKM